MNNYKNYKTIYYLKLSLLFIEIMIKPILNYLNILIFKDKLNLL
jgi:hypothetical protein